MSEVIQKGKLAKEASGELNRATTAEKNKALQLIADQLRVDQAEILAANEQDLQIGRQMGLSDAILDRMMLDVSRLEDMVEAVKLLIDLKDPTGETIESIEKDNGLNVEKIRVPIGVIGMIYES